MVEVVLGGGALRRVLALCDHQVSLYAGTGCAPLGSMAVLTTLKCLVGAHGQEFEFELEARTSRGVTDLPRESPWGRQSPPHLLPPPPPLPLPPHRPPRPRWLPRRRPRRTRPCSRSRQPVPPTAVVSSTPGNIATAIRSGTSWRGPNYPLR